MLLYDLSKDPNETTDLAAQEPERVQQMTAVLDTWKASVQRSLDGGDYDAPLIKQLETKTRKKRE